LLGLLAEEGLLDLEAPASTWLPDLACARGGRPTLLDLALHRSGLPAWRPLYLLAGTREGIVQEAARLAPEAPCGARVVYSDPGYILLGEAIARAAGRPLDALFRDRLARPLGIGSVTFRPGPDLAGRIAPTELGNRHERTLAASLGFDVDGREAPGAPEQRSVPPRGPAHR